MLAKLWNKVIGDPNGASAAVRDYEVSIVPLTRISDNANVGFFVAELYELAQKDMLKDQIAYHKWVENFLANNSDRSISQNDLYAALKKADKHLANAIFRIDLNGDVFMKTPFELAVLPFQMKNGQNFVPDVLQSEISREFHARIKAGEALQYPVSKLTVKDAYLANLEQAGLKVTDGYSSAMHVTLNFSNPVKLQPKHERVMHYSASWLSITLTGVAVATVGAYGLPALAAIVAATIAVKHSGNNFALFGDVENLLREVPTLISKDFKWLSNVKPGAALDAKLKAAAILAITGLATTAMFGAVMSLSLPVVVAKTLPSMMLQALPVLQVLSATVVGATTAVGAFLGSLGPLRKEKGLSLNDKNIEFTQNMGDILPEATLLSNSKKLRATPEATNLERKLLDILDKRAANEGIDLSQYSTVGKRYLVKALAGAKAENVEAAINRANDKRISLSH